jgi:hypothetical protein
MNSSSFCVPIIGIQRSTKFENLKHSKNQFEKILKLFPRWKIVFGHQYLRVKKRCLLTTWSHEGTRHQQKINRA